MLNHLFCWPLWLSLFCVFTLTACQPVEEQQKIISIEAAPASNAFARAQGPRAFEFPVDDGPHPDFQTEWWYYTGNLADSSGRLFGYQLTFFRRALLPLTEVIERSSPWAANQVFMAHLALTDVRGGDFRYYERFERGSAGLAGASGRPVFEVWLQDWSVKQVGDSTYHLRSTQGEDSVDLILHDRQGRVLQGQAGFSPKGPERGNASYYISQPRLETSGSIIIEGKQFTVSGWSWMDHEFSTSALAEEQVGWDWFALHLSDGSELMVYTIRRQDGSLDPYSSGTYITPDGAVQTLTFGDFEIEVNRTWRSPNSGGVYPGSWTVRVPAANLELFINPLVADQELDLSFTYWEGSVEVAGTHEGSELTGHGYVELTGYAHTMQGQF